MKLNLSSFTLIYSGKIDIGKDTLPLHAENIIIYTGTFEYF